MEERPLNNAWVGVDVGKEFHWAHVLDTSGRMLLSCRVENDEADLLALIEEVFSLAEEVLWATDQPGGAFVGERPKGDLRPRPHRGALPRRLPWGV
jgi:hypothetical protein